MWAKGITLPVISIYMAFSHRIEEITQPEDVGREGKRTSPRDAAAFRTLFGRKCPYKCFAL